jgi:tetratricopeptide (TPR) repeat protein
VPAATIEDCRKRLKDTSKELVLLWHKKAQKTKDAALYELADPLYRQYLAHFGNEKDSYDMTFFHAEALWSLERWADAGAEYRRVVEMNPTGKFAKDAAYASVLAAKNALEAEEGHRIDPRPAGRRPPGPPQPLSAGDQRLLAAFDLYVTTVPSSPELAAIEYRRARMLYERDHLEEAVPLLWRVVERHPENELAIYAGSLHLDALNRLGRKAELCRSARTLATGRLAARDGEARKQWGRIVADCERIEARAKDAPKGQ